MRFLIALLTITTFLASSTPAHACCLTNWLYGRRSTPYAVGYAPYGYTAGYAPVVAPYAANYPPVAGYPVATTSALRPTWTGTAPVLSSGVYQAQRPSYYSNSPVYDNPSVYTGLPVTGAYSAARIPVAAAYRGSAPASSYFSATNQYPNTYSAGTAPVGLRSVPLPATPVAPVFAPTALRQGGLSRFFGSWFGTNYRSSYYRAPVTYYRPATTVDPISGTTVTVQQPCTSYAQQLQRTPYSSLQSPGAAHSQPTTPCSTPGCGNSYSAAPGSYGPTNPYALPVPSGIGQAAATTPSTPGSLTVPIPSTSAPAVSSGGYYGQGVGGATNRSPLTGPPSGAAPSQPSLGGDLAPLKQPEIQNRPPSTENSSRPEPRESDRSKPQSYWELQDADDSTAMIRTSRTTQRQAQPIHAPEGYVAPFRSHNHSPKTPVKQNAFEAPPLPARSFDSVEKSDDSNWVSSPIREVSTSIRHAYRTAPRSTSRPIERDMTWKPARQ